MAKFDKNPELDKSKEEGKGAKTLGSTNVDSIKEKGTGFKKQNSFKKGKKGGNSRKVNDPNWYVPNEAIAKDVANLPFAVFNGVEYNQFQATERFGFPQMSVASTVAPGVFVYKYVPWYGNATPTSALNLTMRALYSFVRHANAGKTNYEAPDLMLYIMAMDSVYLLIHEAKRIIRLAYHYNLKNRDIPTKIFETLGIDAADVVGNIANYRAQLNILISKANSLAVPANFNLFKRRAVLGSVVLTDEPNRPTQLIVPQTDGYYLFDGKTSTFGGKLVFKPIPYQVTNNAFKDAWRYNSTNVGLSTFQTPKRTLSNYLDALQSMLDILLADEDMNIMSGDIIKAYGSDLYTIPFIQENEIQEIVHDENLLLQFSNSTVLDVVGASITSGIVNESTTSVRFRRSVGDGSSQRVVTPEISQYNGSLTAYCEIDTLTNATKNPTIVSSFGITVLDNFFLNTTNNEIKPSNIIEWTRLLMMTEPGQGTEASRYWTVNAGTEIGLGWVVSLPKNQQKLPDYSVSDQWFQFGSVDTGGFKLDMPPLADKTEVRGVCFIMDGVKNDTKLAVGTGYRVRNRWYTHQAVNGLNYGPTQFLVNGYDTDKTAIEGRMMIFIDGSVEKIFENTALVSRFNVRMMHDVALLGLISSPYVKD